MSSLTETERQVLAFERGRWRYAGAKETAIRETFGVTPTVHAQRVNALLDNPAALAADPATVLRLRRLREQRRARRAA